MTQPNYDRQAKLAQSAGLPQLQALSQGANPRQVRPFVALGELNARMAQMQSDKMLQGAAPPGSIPTLRERIEQSLQQMKAQAAQQQAAQQAQQQAPGMFQVPEGTPTPQMQPQAEEMAQASAEDAMQMYSGGVAQLPVNDRMFGYANGGIIAFRTGERPEDKEEYKAPTEAELEAQRKADREAAGAGWKSAMESVGEYGGKGLAALADVGMLVPRAVAGAVDTAAIRPLRAMGADIGYISPHLVPGNQDPSSMTPWYDRYVRRNEKTESPAPVPTAAPVRAPAPVPQRDPKQVDLEKLHQLAIAGGNSSMSPSRVGIATPPPGKVVPPTTNAAVNTGAGNAGAPQDDLTKFMLDELKKPGYTPSTPKSIEALDKERQDFVSKQPTSEEALALIRHYDNMAKRYAANDEAEKAQQARNAANNLATFLMNTRGSSLGIAAGKANAALQPLLADQETRRQNYQKLRDEQEMLLGKSRYELAQAERARKEGRFDEARKHQLESQKAELEAAKLAEQRRGHTMTGGIGMLQNQEQRRYHDILAAQNKTAAAESQRRWEAEQQRRQDELEERIRNNKFNNQRLLQNVNKNIDEARKKLSKWPKDSKELAPMREEQENLIKGWEQERQSLLDEINKPTGYDASKVKKIGK